MTDLFRASPDDDFFIAEVTSVELVAALSRRARGGGGLSVADAALACSTFRTDSLGDYQFVRLTAAVLDRAMDLAQTEGLRGYDAIQLSAALAVNDVGVVAGLPPLTFVSAARHGLLVENPNRR